MRKNLNNAQYAQKARAVRGWAYVSPVTRAELVTESGAALLPDEQWEEIEKKLITHYPANILYNPTAFDTDPDNRGFLRFLTTTIKSALVSSIDRYRRVYTALGISFVPNDRKRALMEATRSGEHSETETGQKHGSNVRTGSESDTSTGTTTATQSGQETRNSQSDSGVLTGGAIAAGTSESVQHDYYGYNSDTPHGNGKDTTTLHPRRVSDTETTIFGDANGQNNPTDTSTTSASNTKLYNSVTDTLAQTDTLTREGENAEEHTVNYSGWDMYDIELSVMRNLEIAKTDLSDIIADDIRKAVILTQTSEFPVEYDAEELAHYRTWVEARAFTWQQAFDNFPNWEEFEEVL